MGCCYSRVEREEVVSRCKARKSYMKQFVKARQAFAASHSMYLRSLRSTGLALLQFATAETTLHHHHRLEHHHLPPLIPSPPPQTPVPQPPPPPPPMSPTSETWTTSTTSSALPQPPPPPPPPPSSSWDFWDPFVPTSSRSATEEEWEATTTASEAAVTTTVRAADVAAPPSVISGFSKNTTATTTTSELAVVVSTKTKDLVEIIQELDDYFLKAADAGGELSQLLEVPNSSFSDHRSSGKVHGHGKSLSPLLWTWGCSSPKLNVFGKLGGDMAGGGAGVVSGSHSSTVDRLYAWEKKLYLEVKEAENLKMEHEKRAAQLRKLEMKRGDYVKTEKSKKEVEKLESRLMVSAQAIETISAKIIKLRETELYPQLIEIVKGLMCMWRSMYESHHVQKHIVEQLKYLNTLPSTDPTSEIHHQSTLQLELEVQQWHLSFCSLVQAQRDYIQSLSGWLRLSLFHLGHGPGPKAQQDSAIYSLCEEWALAVINGPDKVASEGIKSLLMVVHAIVVQQSEERKQKKRSESAFKELEKRAGKLRSLEAKDGPFSGSGGPVAKKRAKVEALRTKAEDEKGKYEKSVAVTRAMTLNNLQMGLPHVFQAVTGFANVWAHAFESVYNRTKSVDRPGHEVKMILP